MRDGERQLVLQHKDQRQQALQQGQRRVTNERTLLEETRTFCGLEGHEARKVRRE